MTWILIGGIVLLALVVVLLFVASAAAVSMVNEDAQEMEKAGADTPASHQWPVEGPNHAEHKF